MLSESELGKKSPNNPILQLNVRYSRVVPLIMGHHDQILFHRTCADQQVEVIQWTSLFLQHPFRLTIPRQRRMDWKNFKMTHNEGHIVNMLGPFTPRGAIVEFGKRDVGDTTILASDFNDVCLILSSVF